MKRENALQLNVVMLLKKVIKLIDGSKLRKIGKETKSKNGKDATRQLQSIIWNKQIRVNKNAEFINAL